jgi:ComF family protein
MTRAELSRNCRQTAPQFNALRSWGIFDCPLRNAMHRLKYRRDIALGEALARHLIDLLENLDWSIDLVIPVPLGVARQAERGYNQSALLAKPLALACNLDYNPRSLLKTHDTPSQVGLSLEQRWANVAGSFGAVSKNVAGKHVLVVDDVTTSGATLSACAEALLSAGASQVYALTLARAV